MLLFAHTCRINATEEEEVSYALAVCAAPILELSEQCLARDIVQEVPGPGDQLRILELRGALARAVADSKADKNQKAGMQRAGSAVSTLNQIKSQERCGQEQAKNAKDAECLQQHAAEALLRV